VSNPGKSRIKSFAILFALCLVLTACPPGSVQALQPAPRPLIKPDRAAGSIYWGAYISGETYGPDRGNAPWDSQTWDLFESHAGRKVSILHWGQPWYWAVQPGYPDIGDGHYQRFFAGDLEKVRQRGAIPLLDWGSYKAGNQSSVGAQPVFALANIIDGKFDSYIRRWATEAGDWRHPFFLRFDWEMNGDWFPWSERQNGNSPGQYVQAWRHVHDIFTAAGATNVSWVWCPNIASAVTGTSIPVAELYPGDAYVDWTCLDVYNKYPSSLSLRELLLGQDAGVTWLEDTYQQILTLAPGKPMMIGETASLEYSALKAGWISDALLTQLPDNFPAVKAVLWFNWNSEPGSDFVIESSAAAQAAFARGINSGYYTADDFANLSASPIPSADHSGSRGLSHYIPLILR
jgi:hypothetical protein